MGITTRRDAVAQLVGMNLAHEEVEDALDALLGTGRYAAVGVPETTRALGWGGRWEDLDDAATYDRVSRAVWAHATDGAQYPF